MSKIKDFFNYIYKEFYNSDIGYLITTTIYLIICTKITVAYYLHNPLPLEHAILAVPLLWVVLFIILLPVFYIISSFYAAIDALVFKIKLKLRR